MSRSLIVRGRRIVRPVVWEAQQVTLHMHVGGGEYDWVRMEAPVICVSGKFSEAFAAMNYPGFPTFDADNPDIERELVYTGVNFPTDLEIQSYIREKFQERTAALRARFAVKD